MLLLLNIQVKLLLDATFTTLNNSHWLLYINKLELLVIKNRD